MNNFTLRTLTGAAFLVVMVASLLLHPSLFGLVFVLIMIVAMQEFYRMSMVSANYPVPCKLALFTAVTFFALTLCHCVYGLPARYIAAGILPLMATVISPIFMKQRPEFGMFAYIFAGLLYIAAPVCLAPFVVFRGGAFDGTLMLLFFILIWVSDIGAYCLGTAFGQKPDSRKLAPSISPKKSWWGFWSAVFFCVAAAVGMHFLGYFDFSILHCIALGVIVSCGAVCGDLFESLWKRFFGVKDSGNCIPGHGGMLDRFDSSLVAIPLAAAYMAVFGLL